MKTLGFLRTILSLTPVLALTSCFSPAEDNVEDLDESSAITQLKVTTRAASGDVAYPILVTAYDEQGKFKGKQTINSESEEISLRLNEGTYHITAVSGQGSYSEPSSYDDKSALVSIPSAGYATAPLMMGGADVVLANSNAEVNVVMTYRVASLNLSLSSVPSDVTAVSVGVSPQYKSIDMSGTYKGESMGNVTCSKSGDVWTSNTVYLLPGTGTSTTLTLSLTKADGQVSYSYELAEPLSATVPYTINGTYVESTAPYITGVITIEGWQDERTIDFEFGNGSSGGGSGVEVPTYEVEAIPGSCSAWNGHVVALVDTVSTTEANILLLALNEEKNFYSPAAEGHENEVSDYVNAYNEGDLSKWTVPDEEQARSLKKKYGNEDQLKELNIKISELEGDTIKVSTSGGNNTRYLCEEGMKTFNFTENGSITTAGTSTKYRLRLVKKIHVSKK